MMHEHDFELIAAIAEGELSPAEQSAAEATLASCDDCRSDLELQREALAFIRAAGPVKMNDLERATIYRNVQAAVRPSPTSVSKPSVPWFQRLMPAMAAAAALLVVVGIGSVLVNGAGDADSAAETTTVAGESLRNATDDEMAEATGEGQLGDAADAPTTTMALLAPAVSIVEDLGIVSRDRLKDLVVELTTPMEQDQGAAYSLDRELLESALTCVDVAAADGPITFAARATVDGEQVEVYRVDGLVYVYLAADCSLSETLE
jgi:anti-sigma factor RsiW